MDSLQKIEQKTKYFAKSVFINLNFLIILFKNMRGDVFLTAFQGRNSQSFWMADWDGVCNNVVQSWLQTLPLLPLLFRVIRHSDGWILC